MKTKKCLFGLAAVSLAALIALLPGCSKSSSSSTSSGTKAPMTITWLASQSPFKSPWKDVAAQLKKDENITVQFQIVPDDQIYNLVKMKLATGEVPDIIQYNSPTNDTELNVSKNMVDLSNESWVSRLSDPSLIKDATDGKIYAQPQEATTFFGGLYYNKKVLNDLGIDESQPKTYAELLDRLQQIKAKSSGKITPIFMGNHDAWTTQIFMTMGFSVATYPNTTKITSQLLTNKLKWTDVPEYKLVLEEYNSLYQKGLVNSDNLTAGYNEQEQALGTGKTAMVLQGEWLATDLASKYPDVKLGSWIVPFDDKLITATGAYTQGLFVPKAGKQVANVKKFLNILSEPKYQNIFYKENPGFPGFKDVDSGNIPDAITNIINNYVKTGKSTYQQNDLMAVDTSIQPNLWQRYIKMTMGKMTPEQVLSDWQKEYADFMKQKQQSGF